MLQHQSENFKSISSELEKALAHSKVCESHFKDGNVPRGCAHTVALEGHLLLVLEKLESVKLLHAKMAKLS